MWVRVSGTGTNFFFFFTATSQNTPVVLISHLRRHDPIEIAFTWEISSKLYTSISIVVYSLSAIGNLKVEFNLPGHAEFMNPAIISPI